VNMGGKAPRLRSGDLRIEAPRLRSGDLRIDDCRIDDCKNVGLKIP